MAFWLCRSRDGQASDHVQRFDPRFWTVDFPRPMMASVITAAPDTLRVDCEFHRKADLAGLIWESEDTLDHPLLAYATCRDYSRAILRFRWRSAGLIGLDEVDGPTLTIEGRDADGYPRSWYVRLWNYADGLPGDARIELRFSDLAGGWDIDGEPDPVHPGDIDRMFISLAAPGYAADDTDLLPARVDAWLELSEIECQGERAMLPVGDVIVPPHGVRMATAYDDAYNQTPARLVRSMFGLGYRERVVHYLGMSHFMRLVPGPENSLLADDTGRICTPAAQWHQAYFAACKAHGFAPVASLSYELFAEHCPQSWQQRDLDGNPSRTGWDPPSALLSPANAEAMAWLKAVATGFVALMKGAGVEVQFQVGEPWWWTLPDGRIFLYDDQARAALGPAMPAIPDMRQPLDAGQCDVLDRAGALLAQTTFALRDAVRDAAYPQPAKVLLLAFTPTIFAGDMPELARANLPRQWAWPAFDRLQVEDYDWLTAGAEAPRRKAYGEIDARLGYPLHLQDYFAGFVLRAEDADAFWRRIDVALDEAAARGVDERFVWALPQVCRDGFTRLPATEDDAMQPFDDVPYPLALGHDTGVYPEFSTSIAVTASGHERRSSQWSDARLRYDVGPGIRSQAELGVLIAFFRARRGAARGFRLADPFDFSSNAAGGTPTPLDQSLGTGDGLQARFELVKCYGEGPEPQVRRITRPRAGTIVVSVDGVTADGWTLQPGGVIAFAVAPPAGSAVRAGFEFDVPVRFAEDRLDVTAAAFVAGEAPSVPLIEVREAV